MIVPTREQRGSHASRRVLLALTACLLALGASTGSAAAHDAFPCGPQVDHHFRGSTFRVQYCPLTQGHVPVLDSPSSHSKRIGWLNEGGSANWFFDQSCTGYWYNPILHQTDYPFRLGPYINGWWASTFSDAPSRLGYVSEVYFRGGGNWEGDGRLRRVGRGSDTREHIPSCRT